ncbi:LEAF RUST 10 DISEASE-RESISTANCE LOCUS RECEPTOR-LIKE PROTEIN KINASE-like 2.1, partial [Herrania umbratica]|uniref:LEAF RUST 10 DISEASE-RESISTANCE LOCUS RECEPTOR-LIKE PROTEIN KINASE-like 2.1 n=1 Tax=Herrania umbratica TaxID=108875 RepID=A0A6J1BIC1_9ROSI
NATLVLFNNDPKLNSASKYCKKTVVAPVAFYEGEQGVENMLNRGFVMNWIASNCSICEVSGGKCGFDNTTCYGDVYRGKLLDGRYVAAVKILKKSKSNGEEFVNEVASISRTSHVNVVTLLGFCFEGGRRALVYEFVPNGSLEKFIFQEKAGHRQLEWETLYQIAVGIARGLQYLHRGCNTRILHFDIKPHNILLDADFCPKISDFGLAKLCPEKESAISMTAARGTTGYIAPEVFSRNFGRGSHKSDVYSYGMMILEMVGGRKNINVEVDRTSQIYFPHWIHDRIELDEDLGLQGIIDGDDQERVRQMIIVSLWCIQTDPSNRPPMSRMVEMLEGSIDSLNIPPKPFLSSPPTSPDANSTSRQIARVLIPFKLGYSLYLLEFWQFLFLVH